jgi:hypothetical protein
MWPVVVAVMTSAASLLVDPDAARSAAWAALFPFAHFHGT